jgi:hypothetical protein
VGDVLDGIDGEVKRWSVVAYIPGVSTWYISGVLL